MTVMRYTVLRLMLLFGVMLALWLLGGLVPALRDPVLLVMFTVVVSVVLSYFVLRGPREAMTAQLAGRASGRLPATEQDVDPDAAAEDAEADAAAARAARSAEREAQAEQDAEGQLSAPGVAQHGDESQTRGAAADGAPGRPEQGR